MVMGEVREGGLGGVVWTTTTMILMLVLGQWSVGVVAAGYLLADCFSLLLVLLVLLRRRRLRRRPLLLSSPVVLHLVVLPLPSPVVLHLAVLLLSFPVVRHLVVLHFHLPQQTQRRWQVDTEQEAGCCGSCVRCCCRSAKATSTAFLPVMMMSLAVAQ